MLDNELHKDIIPLTIGASGIALKLADIATVAQQIGATLGALVIFVTLLHRIYIFWKDIR